jgi:hypothetical protein
MLLIMLLVQSFSVEKLLAQGSVAKTDPSSQSKGIAMPDGDFKSLITNMGAIGVLALLVFRLPQIFQIMNEGKKEIAAIMKDIQNEAYTNYATNLSLIMKNSDTRVEKLEEALKEQSKILQDALLRFYSDKRPP